MDELRPLTYSEMQATNPLLPFGLRHYWKGRFLRSLPDELVEASGSHLAMRPPGFSTILFEFIGGAAHRGDPDAMAFNLRDATINASALGIWPRADDDTANVAWVREFASVIAPQATGAEYVNYAATDTPVERLRATYGEAKFARLQALKRRYDPDNLFRFNQNVPPGEG